MVKFNPVRLETLSFSEEYLPTEKQKALLRKLTLSSEFSEAEYEATEAWLNSPRANKETCQVLIDRALNRIQGRNARQKASQGRRSQYQNKGV